MFSGIEVTPLVIAQLVGVFVVGILIFDLFLLLFTPKRMTISRGIVRGTWWFQLLVCAGLAFLTWHFWGS